MQLLAITVLVGLGAVTVLPAPALAQSAGAQAGAVRDFDIPAQPLASALNVFGRQSGLQLTLASAATQGVVSRPVSGRMTPQQALATMLAGTGVQYRISDDATVVVMQSGAEDGPVAADGSLVLDPIDITAGGGTAADAPFLTPGSDAYISEEQIQRVPPSSPGDIFREVPGVMSAANHDGTAINVNIRSSQGLNRVRTMVEGTQQESSGYQGYAGADQRTYIDPELIGGVEIQKGPGSGPYGTGTTSGIVNVRLLEAADLIKDGENSGFRLRGGMGGNAVAPRLDGSDLERGGNDILSDDNWFGSLAGAYRWEKFEFVGAYARRKEGNYFAGEYGDETFTAFNTSSGTPEPREFRFSPFEDGQEVANTSEDTTSYLVKGTLRFDDGQSLQLGYTRYESDFGQVFPTNLRLFSPQQYSLNEVESNRYWLRYKWESDNDLIDLQANIWRTTANELGESRQASQDNDAWGAEIWNTSFFDTRLGGLTLSYGGEYSRSKAFVDGEIDVRGIEFTAGPGGETTITDTISPIFDGEREVFGGYLNAMWTPTDWLTLNGGLRYDGFTGNSFTAVAVCEPDFATLREARAASREANRAVQAEFQAYLDRVIADWQAGIITLDEAIYLSSPGSPEFDRIQAKIADVLAVTGAAIGAAQNALDGPCGTFAMDPDFGGERFSPHIGVTVQPLEGLQLFAKYSEGLRAPSLVELGQTFSDGLVGVNPDLEPEVVKTWEVGANVLRNNVLFNDDLLRMKFVYFRNDYESYITRTGVAEGEGVNLTFFYQNIPDVAISGYEASIHYDTRRFFAEINFNIFDEQFLLATQANIGQPKYSGTVTMGMRFLDGDLELGGRLTFFDERSDDDGIIEAGFGLEEFYYWKAQEIVDVFGSYRFNDNLALGFSVENIADTYYVSPLKVSGIPSPGRTFRVNLTSSFEF